MKEFARERQRERERVIRGYRSRGRRETAESVDREYYTRESFHIFISSTFILLSIPISINFINLY